MNIPSRDECLKLLNEYVVHESIQRHCKKVSEVAVFLAKKLKEKGVEINVELVEAAALLHDSLKAVSFTYPDSLNEKELAKVNKLKEKYPHTDHAEAAYLELKEEYHEIAQLIRLHNPKNILNAKTWEEKLLNYADKRVFSDKVVTLKKRMQYLEEKYNFKTPEEVIAAYQKVEKQIFDILGIEPDKLGEYIE